MGWRQQLPLLCLCLPISSGLWFAGTARSIAADASQQEHQRASQAVLTTILPSALPVSGPPLSHLTPSSACPRLPPSPSFNSQQLDKQLRRYLHFVAKFGKPDILIVGSSRALQGIDPIVLQQTLVSQGYPALKIFNLGVNGATAQLVDLLLRQLLTPDQLPRLILWGDGVRAFNSGRVDLTYHRAIASQSYQLLAAGIRPTLPPIESSQVAFSCAVVSLKRFNYETTGNPRSFDFVPDLNPTLKQQPHDGTLLVAKVLFQLESPADPENQAIAKLQELTGFQSLSDQFKPEAYFQHHPKVQGKYDADYRDFSLNGKQTEAFKHIMAFTKARQIPVVFVNLPLTQIYLDETRTVREKQFRLYLQRFTRSHELSVYDLSQRWSNRNAYFTDPSHLNRYGAAAVAVELGRLLAMPKSLLQGH